MLTKTKYDGYQKGGGTSVSQTNALKSLSQENIFDEDDVERYDADTYRQKYGDRWKKFASSVRDVVQADGTIIREYVIEDPTLLEQLSEDDDKAFKKSSNDLLQQKQQGQKSSVNFMNEFKSNSSHKIGYDQKNFNQRYTLSSSSSSSSAQSCYSNGTISSGTSLTNSKNINLFQPILNVKNNNNNSNKTQQQHQQQQHHQQQQQHLQNNSSASVKRIDEKSYNPRSNSDDVDKEVENIHEQGKQLKQLEKKQYEQNQTVIEYEVLDEHGNQIMINGADQLKKLAACVNEIKQSDGSIVKEYILNDPKVIEQIRNQMKSKPTASIERFSPLPSLSSTLTSSTPYVSQVKQNIQKFQPPTPVKVNKNFEYVTKKGKLIQLSSNCDNLTESDCEELRTVLAKKNQAQANECTPLHPPPPPPPPPAPQQKNFTFQPKPNQMIKSGSLDNILDSKSAVKIPVAPVLNGPKSNLPVYIKYLNQNKSIGSLNKPETRSNLNEVNSKSHENLDKKMPINMTYTKSTKPNFKFNENENQGSSLMNGKKLNKSLDNLDSLEAKEKKNITAEMTEQLLLKLLLHQISLQKDEKARKKFEVEEDDGTSLSNDTFSSSSSNSKPKMHTNLMGSRIINNGGNCTTSANVSSGTTNSSVSTGNLNLNKNKKLLFQKSMSNFNFRMNETQESDMDDFENLMQHKNMNQFNAAKNKLKQNFF